MKIFIGILILTFVLFPDLNHTEDKEVREKIVVINVEFPVRVVHKGRLVDNLKKSDFSLFENEKKIDINGFNLVRKKISYQSVELESERKQIAAPRFFVLAFSVTNFNKFYEEGIQYLFRNILRSNDQLMVFINNTTKSYDNLENLSEVQSQLIDALREEGKRARQILRKIIMTVENNVSSLISQIRLANDKRIYVYDVQTKRSVLEFFLKYQAAWKSYQKNFLRLNIYTMYNFASFLKRINLEKWVISFYQNEKFPVLDKSSEDGRKIIDNIGLESSRIYNQISWEIISDRNFPHEAVSKLFYNLGATFNLVVIPTRIETDSQNVKMSDITTAKESTLREIAKKTGGSVTFSTDLSKSIKKIVEREDIYYLLTYAPENPSTREEIKVKSKNPGYKLIYDDNNRAPFLKRRLMKQSKKMKIVSMRDLNFQNKQLSFKLFNFKILKKKKNLTGSLNINIIIKDMNKNNEILFDKEKVLTPTNKTMDVTIGFKWLKRGKYDLLLDVKDELTGRSLFEYIKLDVK